MVCGLLGTVTGVLGSLVQVISFQSDPNGIEVRAIKWAPSHVNQVRSVSGTIGYDGGTLAIPGSDFSITFPKGALYSPTSIKIVSDGSGYVSYDMQPHGLKFAEPVIVTQRLIPRAYFGQQSLLDLSGILKALEIERTSIYSGPSGQAEVETWELRHFSRYMLASG